MSETTSVCVLEAAQPATASTTATISTRPGLPIAVASAELPY